MPSLNNISTVALSTVVVIVGGIVGLIVLAALAPTYFDSLGDLVGVFTSTAAENSTGTTAGDDLKQGLAPVLSIGGVIGILALAFGVLVLKVSRGRF